MSQLLIPGIPGRLSQDAWWLEAADLGRGPAPTKQKNFKWSLPVALFSSILAADLLFWNGGGGLALIVFVQLVTAMALYLSGRKVSNKVAAIYGGLSLIFSLPWFVFPQTTAFLFLTLGHLAIFGFSMRARFDGFSGRFFLLWLPLSLRAIFQLSRDGITHVSDLHPSRSTLKDLILPNVALIVFLTLFGIANPMIEQGIENILFFEIPPDLIKRVVFWILILAIILPVLRIAPLQNWLAPPQKTRSLPKLRSRTLLWTLIASNAVFALQMVLDGSVLLFDAGLPLGISYAEYAHRGAYPLAVTALLALGFMLIAHAASKESKFLRGLLFFWIFQNALLLCAALYRMWIYVDAFGLTYLRLYGTVGMIWVLIALALMVVILTTTKSPKWLIGSLAIVASTTVYAASLTNVAHFIAQTNLKMSLTKTDPAWLDRYYLCNLMPHGVAALNDHIEQTENNPIADLYWPSAPKINDWRDWSLRGGQINLAMTRYHRLKGEP